MFSSPTKAPVPPRAPGSYPRQPDVDLSPGRAVFLFVARPDTDDADAFESRLAPGESGLVPLRAPATRLPSRPAILTPNGVALGLDVSICAS
jgi:hypothetical protein